MSRIQLIHVWADKKNKVRQALHLFYVKFLLKFYIQGIK
jgi:hypothetical protein